jgi:hypothetical protein
MRTGEGALKNAPSFFAREFRCEPIQIPTQFVTEMRIIETAALTQDAVPVRDEPEFH